MINFDKPKAAKTAEEIAFDNANKDYFDKFGTYYVFDYAAGYSTLQEATADIRRRIKEDDKQKTPEYKPGVDY